MRVAEDVEPRFMGKSSGAYLVNTAIDLKATVQHRERRQASGTGSPAAGSHSDGSLGGSLHRSDESEREARPRVKMEELTESEDESEDDWASTSGTGFAWTTRRLQYWTFKPVRRPFLCLSAH